MTRIIIARHAQPEMANDLPHANWPLSRFGRNQADHLAGRLQEFAPLNVVAGPSTRSRETAEVAAKQLGKSVKVDPRFGEAPAPKGTDLESWLWQMFSFDRPMRWSQVDANLSKWRNDNLEALRELKEPSVVFTQYTNINAIMSAALHLDVTAVCRPDFASITEFSLVNGDLRLVVNGMEIVGPNE
jgi:broad specificity phosphatase PhoE